MSIPSGEFLLFHRNFPPQAYFLLRAPIMSSVHPLAESMLLIAAKAGAALAVILVAGNFFWNKYLEKDYYYFDNPACNIAVIPIEGGISTVPDEMYFPVAADKVLADLRLAANDPYIEGILVRIDSPGGTPVAAAMIADALRMMEKPVAALIRESGTSGGYWVATGADTIIASPFSSVGSIGITSSYIETAGQLTKEGKRFVELVSAPFKEVGNPDRPLSPEEQKLFEDELQVMHQDFVAEVAKNRSLPLEEVEKIADGSAVLGARALELGLIDILGDQETARGWFETALGGIVSDFCEPPPPVPTASSGGQW
jgi:protease IV